MVNAGGWEFFGRKSGGVYAVEDERGSDEP
jgi:hypothetical protein